MNFKLCMALAILSFSAYARGDWKLNPECSEEDYELGLCEEGRHLRDEDGSAESYCDEADYEMGLCKEGRRLRRDYYAGEDDDEADYCADYNMIWDEDMGGCIDGRRLARD